MKSIIIASEPLTEDSTTWIEVPEYSMIGTAIEQNKMQISSIDIASYHDRQNLLVLFVNQINYLATFVGSSI